MAVLAATTRPHPAVKRRATSLRRVAALARLTVGLMMRKLLWMMAILVVVSAVSTVVDRREAARRRELWAEATDPA